MSRYSNHMRKIRCEFIGKTTETPIQEGIEMAELLLGLSLPPNYREFLSNHGGSAPGIYTYFKYLDSYPRDQKGIVDVFFGILPGSTYDLSGNISTYEGRLPKNMLPIACDPGDNLICLAIEGANKDCIYYWDHNNEEDIGEGEIPGYSNIYLVSQSFDNFIDSLELIPEGDED